MNDDELAAIVQYEIANAQGYDSDTLAVMREKALNYYNGIMTAPAEGRSSVVSMDVADSHRALMGQLAPIIKTTLLEFTPNGEEDEPEAQAESDFVRSVIKRSGGWRAVFEGIHDALLVANGWIKIDTEDVTTTTTEIYPPNLPDEAYVFLNQPTAANQKVQIRVSSLKTTVKRTTTKTKLTFECIPPEDMLFSEGPGQEDIQQLRFVGQRKLYTDAQLDAAGVSKEVIGSIPEASNSSWPGARAREGAFQNDMDNQAAQESQRLREVYCCYLLLSANDSNKTERRYIWIGGSNILKNEPAEDVPYVTGSPVPMPHRVQGQGLYEILQSIQAGKTHVLRNYLDNLDVLNGSRVQAVENRVNMGDLTNGRLNGVVRVKDINSLAPIPASDIGQQAMAGLEYLDHVRTQRVGSSVDINEVQAQVMKSSATAAAGQLAMVEQMAGWFAENLVETLLKPAFMRVHKLLRTDLAGPTSAKIRGKWQQTDTGQWQPREELDITMGMTTAEKAARIGALSQVITNQSMILQMGGGGILTDNAKMYNAMCDWCRANDLHEPEQYLIDPTSPEAQQAQQAQAQQQQQQMQQQQKQIMDLQRQVQAFELEKQSRDLRYKVWSDQLDAEVEEAKMTADNVVKLKTSQAGKEAPDNAE
jgi:hypothetical protein